MLRCMTSAIAGLKANMTGIDVTGNNISNVNTDAFKSSSVSFRDTMYQEISGATANSNNAAGTNPSQIGYGSAASSINVDTTAGGQNATGKASDVYIKGDGYLIVGGSSKNDVDDTFTDYKYTRLGTLSWDSAGYLTAGSGNYVVGYQYDTENNVMGNTPKAIKLPTATNISNISIASDGTITCNKDGEIVKVGQIVLATFTNPAGLSQLGNSFYGRTDNSGAPNIIAPGTNGTNTLITGSLEASNVDLATEFSNLIIYERGYQANTKVITVADEMLQTLVNMK
jgi:flagellar hook protein FlgE